MRVGGRTVGVFIAQRNLFLVLFAGATFSLGLGLFHFVVIAFPAAFREFGSVCIGIHCCVKLPMCKGVGSEMRCLYLVMVFPLCMCRSRAITK
jgi:hypothetical protein